jgi:type III pantothenate kinase
MLLVIDVGNTNIVLGLYETDRLVRRFRIRTVASRTADEMGVLIHDLFRHTDEDPKRVDGAIVSCVVPDQLHVFRRACQRYFNTEALVVGPGVKTGMPILLDNPREVGADRIVNAVAAYARIQGRCVVVDFGTATTFDCVSDAGEYLGGAIAPGYQISATALFNHASKLPRVEIARPDTVVGKNTIHSMQSGLFYGYVGLVDGVVTRIIKELGPPRPAVLATGGLASVIGRGSETIDEVIPDLTLEGLRLIYRMN